MPLSDRIVCSRDRQLDENELIELYDAVGWGAYTARPQDFGPMIANATLVLTARDGAAGDRLVGLVRVVGDGVSIAYVQDLLVHPDHQRQGIGGVLLDLVLECTAGVRQTVLMTDVGAANEHVVALYRSRGFTPMAEEQCVGLVRFR